MNIFNKVTLQTLKKNKTRTVVTIIGIVLSAAMICAVTTFVSSIYNYALENAIYAAGDWHGSALGAEYETYEDIRTSGEVSDVVYGQQLGYAIAEGCENPSKPYLYVLGVSDGFEETMSVHITLGKYPVSADEILLPNHLAENGGVKYEIGDSVTLELGNRMIDGYALNQGNPYNYDSEGVAYESLEVKETRSYTVVGFYERPGFERFSAPGYSAITLADKNPSDSYQYDVYFKMKKAKDVYAFMEEHQITGDNNTSVLTYSGVSRFDGFQSMIMGLAVIVIGLIMFGSVSLIYNAFSISVSERTKQFGLLSSIGATKRQLRKMVLFEALTVSAIGIPLGIFAGISGIGITLLLIGHKFQNVIGYPIPLRICVSPASIVIAASVALLTVLISAWIPSRRATKVTAVEAIRQNLDINAKGKPVKTSKLMYKLFGLPGMLANKHYKRSKKRYRSTIVSLFMSIVLFVSASAFTEYLMESVTEGYAANDYDLMLYYSEDDSEDTSKDELLELFKDDAGVTDVAYTQVRLLSGTIDRSYLSSKALANIGAIAIWSGGDTAWGPMDSSEALIDTCLVFVNDAKFRELLNQYDLDEAIYMNTEEPLAIAIDGNTSFFEEQGKYVTMNVLKSDTSEITIAQERSIEGYYSYGLVEDENGNAVVRYENNYDPEEILDVPVEEAYEYVTVKSGKTIYEKPFYLDYDAGVILLYPESMADIIFADVDVPEYSYRFFFTSDDHKVSNDAITETLIEEGLSRGNLVDYAERVEENRSFVTVIQVFAYGFIVLISLIAAANVFNTISTNINLRRREFAMLKSVGMSAKGFNRMMNFECLLYGTRALLYGLPVSVGVTYLIYRAVSEGYSTSFYLPWTSIGIAVLSVFAVVFVTMMYSMSKIKKDNPIDALKNENL